MFEFLEGKPVYDIEYVKEKNAEAYKARKINNGKNHRESVKNDVTKKNKRKGSGVRMKKFREAKNCRFLIKTK